MEQLYVFGTGHAAVTRYYNTCFAVRDGDEYFMVDAGGGNGILGILENMNVDLGQIHHILVTHEHCDHLLGIIWMIRMIATRISKGEYKGCLNLYCHKDLMNTTMLICRLTLQMKLFRMFGEQIRMHVIEDGDETEILGHSVTFFDIHSTKARQFGFRMLLNSGKCLVCTGDEPVNPQCAAYTADCDWLLHEAFCRYEDRERFQPYEKHHSTVKDACEFAQSMNVKNLVLWHTEDKHTEDRSRLYAAEGASYFRGRLLIPEDGDIIALD